MEAGFGRRRERPNGPRTLDLDILDYQGVILNCPSLPSLELPHPRLHQRDFALLPLQEVAPNWRHPSLNLPVSSLIAALERISARPAGEMASH
jgi:2-amino-4-hydroxy-6-hydroxymethyldihydropteridine diphosphokinase